MKNLPSPGQPSLSGNSLNPAARKRSATVAHTWNGDGDASMKSHRPCALAVMVHHDDGLAVR
jgi:hypothetical protein